MGASDSVREQAALERTTNDTEVNQTLQRRHCTRPFDFDLDSERAAMGHLLGLAVDEEYESTGRMISSIVLYLNENDAQPGFFTKTVDLGDFSRGAPRGTSANPSGVEQVTAVREYYRAQRRARARVD